jgi:hypothetical protein
VRGTTELKALLVKAMPWRMCPDSGVTDNLRTCQCSDIEMTLNCLEPVLLAYLVALGEGGNRLEWFAREDWVNAFKTYATEDDLIYDWTRDS